MRAATLCCVAVLSLLQIGTAVAVIAITAVQLANVKSFTVHDLWNQKICLATANYKDLSVCTYIYAVGAVSIVLTILIALLQMLTCKCCGCGKVLDAIFTVLAAAWWLVAGFVTAAHAKAANDAKPPLNQKEWRNAVVLLCWITSGLFALLFIVHSGRILVSCCRKRRKGAASDADVEKAELARRDRPPSAAVELGKEVANRPYMLGRFGGKAAKDPAVASNYLGGPNI